jgi:2-polyprenyl-3-methyl-5-hydroxy-6-metoxy-1,4-benzoquinol methylase
MKDAAKQQEEIKRFWSSKPCDSELSEKDSRNKRVLEIRTGVGTEARKIIGLGGIYTGINVDAGSVDLTVKALSTFSLRGEVRQCIATGMAFGNESFDIVYSYGVLHHIIYFFDYRHWGILGRLLPRALTNFLGRHWVWH